MKKLILNVPLKRKAEPYRTTKVAVEKIVEMTSVQFQELKNHPMQDNPMIAENIPYMWMDSEQAHCVLFLDTESGDGILVDSEGFGYARYSQFIPNAQNLCNAYDMSMAEWRLHVLVADIAQNIAQLAHKGADTADVEAMLSEIGCNPTELFTDAVIAALHDRVDIRRTSYKSNTVVQVEAKPTEQLMLYCPVAFQTDDTQPRTITPENACLIQTELQEYLSGTVNQEALDRGFMTFHMEQDSLSEKVISAMPRFEIINGGLMLAVACRIAEPLTELELNELKEEIRWQLADHAENVMEDEKPVQTPLGAMRVVFWSDSPDWCVQTADELDAANAPDEELSEPTM